MKLHLIEGWRQAWRYTSVWASGVGFSALTAWGLMPMAVRDVVPDWIEILAGGLLFAIVFLARVTAQPKATAKVSESVTQRGGE